MSLPASKYLHAGATVAEEAEPLLIVSVLCRPSVFGYTYAVLAQVKYGRGHNESWREVI